MRIGVIADTHGRVLPAVHDAFTGVSLILHAGDVGGEAVIAELSAIARVVAVRGNTDTDLGPPLYPDTRRMTLEGVDIFLCHEPARAAALPFAPDVVVHGHTHRVENEWRGRTLWFNPGTAGKAQFSNRDLTVGILTLNQGTVEAQIIDLSSM